MTALAMTQEGLKPATKIVLYWLAFHHNEKTGACFPSLSTLAKECEMDKATVVRHLSVLESAGLIARNHRSRDDGSRTSTSYILSLKQPVANNDKPVAKCDTPVAKRNSPCRKTQMGPVAKCDTINLGSNNIGNEHIRPSGLFDLPEQDERPDNGFEAFWAKYPRKVKKKDAKARYDKIVKRVTPAVIMATLDSMLPQFRKTDAQYIPHPTSWLNSEPWQDTQPAQFKPSANPDVALRNIARQIELGVVSDVTPQMARECVEAGLVSADKCKARGLMR